MATIPRTVPPEASSQSVRDAKRQIFRKLFLLQFLRLAFLGTTLFLFLFGFAVLISRFLRSELAITVLSWTWMLEFLLLAGVGWIAWNRVRQLQSRFGEWIDSKAKLGGLLMLHEELQQASPKQGLPPTSPALQVSADQLPLIGYRYSRHLLFLVLGFFFLLGACLFPMQDVLGRNQNMDLSTQVDQFQKQIDALEEEKAIEPEMAEQLEEQLLQISRQASKLDPAETWQALEQLQEQIQDQAAIATQKMVEEGQQLAEVEEKAAGSSQATNDLGTMQDLNDLLQEQLSNNSEFKDAVGEDREFAELLEKIEKSFQDLLDAQKTEAKLLLSEKLTPEQRGEIEKALEELGIEPSPDGKTIEELDAEKMKKLAELQESLKGKSIEDQLRELAEKLEKSELAESPPMELSQQQLEQLKQQLDQLNLGSGDLQLLQQEPAQLATAKEQKVISQAFINNEIDPDNLKKAAQIVGELKIPIKQYGEIKLEILDGLKEILADGKIENQELDPLRPEIDDHLFSANEIPAVENQTLEQLRQKWEAAGIADEDYLILESSDCECQGSGGSPSDEDLIGLAKKAKALRAEMRKKLQKLQDSGALSEKLAKQALQALSSPGGGSISRGRGDSPMTFREDPTNIKDKKFKPLMLPLNRINEEQSQLLAIQKGSAEGVEQGDIDGTRVLGGQKSVGETARTTLLPEHRIYLEKYRKNSQQEKQSNE